MAKRTDLKIPYGVSDFKTIRNEGLYYVDKTEYLAKIEARDRFVFFVRPRRFGKSLFVDMLRLYYDRNEKDNFERLFGGLWLGANPTVPTLAKDTRLHLILYQFKGTELIRLEEIPA